MSTTYTASNARNKFAEVMKKVRSGETVVIILNGFPIAEIKPVNPFTLNK